jgi:transcriptional regulator with XRE-family HTH domain
MSRFPTELRRWRTARRLSQLELAARAGTTQRHVSFVELGRSRPGRNVVMRLAESLDLTLRERNDLLISAGFAPAFPESPLDDAALRPIREALDRILDGHLPYPALVVRPRDLEGVALALSVATPLEALLLFYRLMIRAGGLSSAYRKPHTCWQHHAA